MRSAVDTRRHSSRIDGSRFAPYRRQADDSFRGSRRERFGGRRRGRGREGRAGNHRLDHGPGQGHQGEGDVGHPDRAQARDQGARQGRDGDQVRRGHRARGRAHPGGRACARPQHQDETVVSIMDLGRSTFQGYKRENGRVGVRNHVIILPVDDLSNAASEAVANNIKGAMAIPHPYGRLQFGADLELHFRTLIGTGSNPNVAAVVVIGIEDGWTKRVVDGIAKTGKPVTGFGIEGHGDIATISNASYVAKQYVQMASELQREECGIADLWVSTKCGESDTTTGLASCPTVGNMYDKLIPRGIYGVFGETSEITGRQHLPRARAINK